MAKDYKPRTAFDNPLIPRRKTTGIVSPSKTSPTYPATYLPDSSSTDDVTDNSGFKDIPQLYVGPHQINPAYDSSIGSDILAGGRLGSQVSNGNPFHDAFAAIGGLVGGAFNKNLAGKEKYQQDVQSIQQYNQNVQMKTEAQARLEAQATQRQREARIAQHQDAITQIRQQNANLADKNARIKFNLQILQSESDPDARDAAVQNLSQDGYTVSNDFGKKYSQVKAGDYQGMVDQFGDFHYVMDKDGNPVTNLTTGSYLDILKKTKQIGDFSDADVTNAIKMASTETGKMNFSKPEQRSAATINLAKTILQNQGRSTGLVTIGGQKYEIPIPSLKTPTGQPVAPSNQDQSTDNNGQPIADATKWVEQFTTPDQIDAEIGAINSAIKGASPVEKRIFQQQIGLLQGRKQQLGSGTPSLAQNPSPSQVSQPKEGDTKDFVISGQHIKGQYKNGKWIRIQ